MRLRIARQLSWALHEQADFWWVQENWQNHRLRLQCFLRHDPATSWILMLQDGHEENCQQTPTYLGASTLRFVEAIFLPPLQPLLSSNLPPWLQCFVLEEDDPLRSLSRRWPPTHRTTWRTLLLSLSFFCIFPTSQWTWKQEPCHGPLNLLKQEGWPPRSRHRSLSSLCPGSEKLCCEACGQDVGS